MDQNKTLFFRRNIFGLKGIDFILCNPYNFIQNEEWGSPCFLKYEILFRC